LAFGNDIFKAANAVDGDIDEIRVWNTNVTRGDAAFLASYNTAILAGSNEAAGLVLRYSFDQGSGDNIKDESGNNNTGVVLGRLLYATPGAPVSAKCPSDCSGNGSCCNGGCICKPGFSGPACTPAAGAMAVSNTALVAGLSAGAAGAAGVLAYWLKKGMPVSAATLVPGAAAAQPFASNPLYSGGADVSNPLYTAPTTSA